MGAHGQSTDPAETADERESNDLDRVVAQIGVARLVGRINAGVVEPGPGYKAVERYMAREHDRPFLSRLTHALLGRADTFD